MAGRAVFKWEVDRVRREMVIATLIVNSGATRNPSAALFRGFEKFPRPVNGQNVDRLNATIFGAVNQDLKVTYQLTLNDLQFSDKNSAFFLRALFESSNDGRVESSGAAVTLIKVNGNYFFVLCF